MIKDVDRGLAIRIDKTKNKKSHKRFRTKIYDETSVIGKHGLTKYYLWKAENQSGNEVLTEVKKMKLMTGRVIIIGDGVAGLELAKKLSDNKHFEVIVVDRNNYHFFPPLLYQVSTEFN